MVQEKLQKDLEEEMVLEKDLSQEEDVNDKMQEQEVE